MTNQQKLRNAHITIFPGQDRMNFSEGEYEDRIKQIDKTKIQYAIYQGELTKKGRQHIQLYAQFKGQQRYSAIKKIFNDETIHITPITYGDEDDCVNYCKDTTKEVFQPPVEYGERKRSGRRTDLEGMKERIEAGERIEKIAQESPKMFSLYLQYRKGLEAYQEHIQNDLLLDEVKDQYKDQELRPFQQQIMDIVETEKTFPDERIIHWYYETEGNTGKSWLTKKLIVEQNAVMFNTGKQQDILYGYNKQPVIVFDLPRQTEQNESIYTTMELLKNGTYFSTKYESKSVICKIPTIIVFSNFKPVVKHLSKDRWNIHEIQSDKTTIPVPYEELKKLQDRPIYGSDY